MGITSLAPSIEHCNSCHGQRSATHTQERRGGTQSLIMHEGSMGLHVLHGGKPVGGKCCVVAIWLEHACLVVHKLSFHLHLLSVELFPPTLFTVCGLYVLCFACAVAGDELGVPIALCCCG